MKKGWLTGLTPLLVAVLLAMLPGCGGGEASHAVGDSHSQPDSHDDHGEAVVPLDATGIKRLGLEVATARAGELEIVVELPGEVNINEDRMAHVAPRVGGVARTVHASLGSSVRTGDLLAVLESRELADSKTDYLAAAERKQLAEATFRREDRLWQRKVSSEQDYLDARTAQAEAAIALRAAEQKLHALGLSDDDLQQLQAEPDAEYTIYRLTAPFDGEVIDRHIAIGEPISPLTPVFTIADLSTIWVDLRVHLRDLAKVTAGDRVRVRAAHDGIEEIGKIEFVQPLLGEETRTALARVILENPERNWRPGMFVSASVISEELDVTVRVPKTALIRMDDGDDVVFVETGAGFKAEKVTIGRRAQEHVEILSGLQQGQRYVAKGGFNLKAELGKTAFGDGHGH